MPFLTAINSILKKNRGLFVYLKWPPTAYMQYHNFPLGATALTILDFLVFLLCFFLLGRRHDGSEWHDSSDVGSLQDTQVCVLVICGTEHTSAHLALDLWCLWNIGCWEILTIGADTHWFYKLEHVSADYKHECAHKHIHPTSRRLSHNNPSATRNTSPRIVAVPFLNISL